MSQLLAVVTATRGLRGKCPNPYLSNRTDLCYKNMAPQFLWTCLTNRAMNPEMYSEPG